MRDKALKAFPGLATATRTMWLGDQMRLVDRDQRMQEAFQKSMQPDLKPEEEVRLSVDSPVTTHHNHYPAPVIIKPNPWPWIALVAALGLAGYWLAQRPATPATPAPAAAPGLYGLGLGDITSF